MLRASARHNNHVVALRGIGDPSVDVGLPGGRALDALVTAAVRRDATAITGARDEAIRQLGVATTTRAIAVAANFEMMNRLLDAVGMGPPESLRWISQHIAVPFPDADGGAPP